MSGPACGHENREPEDWPGEQRTTPEGRQGQAAGWENRACSARCAATKIQRMRSSAKNAARASPEIVDRLHAALERGVDVVFLVPVDPHPGMRLARGLSESKR